MKTQHYPIIIIGSGAAGLSLALRLAAHTDVAIFSKGSLEESSTLYAQGGIAAVLAEEDSMEDHIQDTLNAGAGLCHPEVVRHTVQQAPDIIQWLVNQGVEFTTETRLDGRLDYHLHREGGHSYRRVLHAEDATGREIETKLSQQLLQRKNITRFTQYTAIDIITHQGRAVGLYALNNDTQAIHTFSANFVVLATGGASKVYLYTSNPDCASGDGIAMAWRKGCRVANLEFNQFHPTCLYHPEAKSLLITEAVRGEGGILQLPNGKRFMPDYDERAELAPRDIVARAIDHEMKKFGFDQVYLDISFKPADFILSHFPNVYRHCLKYGFDITQHRIPVVPAAHYTCGGIVINLQARTDLPGLYAIGEVACSGLHGANRMASNSLLECLVFAKAAANDIIAQLPGKKIDFPIRQWDATRVISSDEDIVISHNWHELRQAMWDYVGIARTNSRLQRAHNRIELLQREIQEFYANFKISKNFIELRNLAIVAELIIRCARQRQESRGLHYNSDYPTLNPTATDTILMPKTNITSNQTVT